MRFIDTPNKRVIRKFDKKIIEKYSVQKDEKLSYFGLPGGQMLDILEWSGYLERWVAVEIDDDAYSDLNFTALEKNLASGLKAIKGDIDDMLLGNVDDRVEFPFDLFNLDYSGGAIYKDKAGEARRLKAWGNLFLKQGRYKHDFLLFLTLNSREKDEGEINEVLIEIQKLLKKGGKGQIALIIEKTIREGKKRDKFKIYIPYLITQYAAYHKYMLRCHPPICYTGSSNIPMMHFIFELEFKKGRASPLSPFSVEQIIKIPLYRCENGVIYDEKGGKI